MCNCYYCFYQYYYNNTFPVRRLGVYLDLITLVSSYCAGSPPSHNNHELNGMQVQFLGDNQENAYFGVTPCDDQDLEMLAVMQALISLGLPQIVDDAGGHAKISVWRYAKGSTRAGLHAQMAPLLPFAASYEAGPPEAEEIVRDDESFVWVEEEESDDDDDDDDGGDDVNDDDDDGVDVEFYEIMRMYHTWQVQYKW